MLDGRFLFRKHGAIDVFLHVGFKDEELRKHIV
jgi:hypothetical protein